MAARRDDVKIAITETAIICRMSAHRDQFVIDESGKKTGVLIDIDRYSELLEAQDELDAIRAFDEAKPSPDQAIPLPKAIEEIEGK